MSSDSRRYPPTGRRLARLREAGVVPHSPVLTSVGVITGAALAIALVARTACSLASSFAQSCFVAAARPDPAAASDLVADGLRGALGVCCVIAAGGAFGGIITHCLQTGFVWTWPARHRRGAIGFRQANSLARETAIALGVAIVASAAVARGLQAIASPQPDFAAMMWVCVGQALAVLLPGLIGLGLLDGLWRRLQFGRDARMTETQMRDELRETEPASRRLPAMQAEVHRA